MPDRSSDFESFSGNLTTTPNSDAGYLYLDAASSPVDKFASTTDQFFSGSKSLKFKGTSSYSSSGHPYINGVSGTGNYYSFRAYYRISSLPASGYSVPLFNWIPYGSCGPALRADGTIQWQYWYGALSFSGPVSPAITLNSWFRLEGSPSGSAATRWRYYANPGATVESYTTDSGALTGGEASAFYGIYPLFGSAVRDSDALIDPAQFTGDIWVDDMAVVDRGAVSTEYWIGPSGGPPPPTTQKGWGISR